MSVFEELPSIFFAEMKAERRSEFAFLTDSSDVTVGIMSRPLRLLIRSSLMILHWVVSNNVLACSNTVSKNISFIVFATSIMNFSVREINDNLEAMAKQLYDYWFVQFDFPNEEGKPYKSSGGAMMWNERLKREIPVGWQVENLIDFAEIKNGATPSTTDDANYGGNIVWITPKDLSDQQSKFVYQGERNITKQGFDSCSTSMLPTNSVLMSSRAPIGLVSIAKHEVCTNQGFKSFIPKNIENSIYLYYYIKHHIKQIEQLGTGTTFKEVSRDDLCKFPILVVGANEAYKQWIELQDKIANKQFVLKKEITALTKQRDKLLPLLMNGQASVNSD